MSKKDEEKRLKAWARSPNICLARRKVGKRTRMSARHTLRLVDEGLRSLKGS